MGRHPNAAATCGPTPGNGYFDFENDFRMAPAGRTTGSFGFMAATISTRRGQLAEFARSRRGEARPGRMVGRLLVAVVILALVAAAGLWLAGFFSTPKEVLAVRAAVEGQVAELERMSRGDAPYAEGSQFFGPVMQAVREVPEQYREQARREIGRLFEAREAAEVNSYFALPPTERAAELDRRIQDEVMRRARWEAERERRSAERGDESRGGAAGPRADGGPQAQISTPAGSGTTPPRGRGDGTEESRNLRGKQRLDQTSAVSRARSTEYRRAKDQRRIQLGLEPRR